MRRALRSATNARRVAGHRAGSGSRLRHRQRELIGGLGDGDGEWGGPGTGGGRSGIVAGTTADRIGAGSGEGVRNGNLRSAGNLSALLVTHAVVIPVKLIDQGVAIRVGGGAVEGQLLTDGSLIWTRERRLTRRAVLRTRRCATAATCRQ